MRKAKKRKQAAKEEANIQDKSSSKAGSSSGLADIIARFPDYNNKGLTRQEETSIKREAGIKPIEAPDNSVDMKENSEKIKRLLIIFDQEARYGYKSRCIITLNDLLFSLLTELETVDSKMSGLAQQRSSYVQQLHFLNKLKGEMNK